MNIKTHIKALLSTIFAIFLIHCIYITLTEKFVKKYDDCGIIKSKSNDEVVIKYGTRTELYLNVQFEKTGFKSVNVEPTTYFSKTVGQEVCFELNANESAATSIKWLIGIITLIIIGIGILMFFIDWLFEFD
jgi:hypothetical protein